MYGLLNQFTQQQDSDTKQAYASELFSLFHRVLLQHTALPTIPTPALPTPPNVAAVPHTAAAAAQGAA